MTDQADLHWDALWTNVHLATLAADADGYGEIRDGAIAVKDGRIAWLGARADLPANARATRDDCHNGCAAATTSSSVTPVRHA